MSVAPPTFGQIISDIQIETKNYGTEQLVPWLQNTFNEEFAQYTSLNKFVQLFVKDEQLSLTANTEAVALPADLQHLQLDSVRYYPAGSNPNTPQPVFLRNFDKYRQTTTGWPTQWIRENNQLLITPFVEIQTGDYLLIDYYKRPTVLVNTDDQIPIPQLIPVLKAAVMSRAITFSDIAAYRAFTDLQRRQYIASQSVT